MIFLFIIDACDKYTTLDEAERLVSSPVGSLCDKYLVEGWYRFVINGNNANIITYAPGTCVCGTTNPIWWSSKYYKDTY